MAIVTYQYYTDTYMGETIAQTDFPRIEARAERAIAKLTHGRATEANFAALYPFQQAAVQEAICAQCEYYALYGTEISVNGDTGSAGWSIGEMRINGRSSSASGGKENIAATMICAGAIAALEQTGLLNPQVDTRGEPFVTPWGWYW